MWKTQEFVEIPLETSKLIETVHVEKKTVKIKGTKISYQEVTPSQQNETKPLDVLMLHGASFTSQTWVDIGTAQLIAAMGHRVVALDLPGYGNSSESFNFKLQDFISAVHLEKPVIVSPSMSGSFSIPYIFADVETWRERVTAFIPVAPVKTAGLAAKELGKCTIPTMHVVGERDTVEGKIGCGAMRDLSALPNMRTVVLEEAGHACYMNQTKEWNKCVYNFFKSLGTENE